MAAHPDDETLGASALLALAGAAVFHLTDGAPADALPGARRRRRPGARDAPAPRLLEMALYHGAPGHLVAFALAGGPPGRARPLAGEALRRKGAMLDCFESQREVLRWLGPPEVERLRAGAPCDFARPPHGGPLWYERLGMPPPPRAWRARAAEAAARALARGHVGAAALPAAAEPGR